MKRLIVFFHYDPDGQLDATCLRLLDAVRQYAGRLVLVVNGTLNPASRGAAVQRDLTLMERENVGFDVGAYQDALQKLGRETVTSFDELILMNYTIAGPVESFDKMFAAMDAQQSLDFWGITRHYAMKSRRFHTEYGMVPEHIQSHFIAVRHAMLSADSFWEYWRTMPRPKNYEEAVGLHEARFTPHFAQLGYRWDTYVNTGDLKNCFVNPIMACPAELLQNRDCPIFKRRSFFTPYADELRRTTGNAARELYDDLKKNTSYPIDDMIRELLRTQPLTEITRQMHWDAVCLPEAAPDSSAIPFAKIENQVRTFVLPQNALLGIMGRCGGEGAEKWYAQKAAGRLFRDSVLQASVRCLFEQNPLLGLVSPAVPAFAPSWEEHSARWKTDYPAVQNAAEQMHLKLCSALPPFPYGNCIILRTDAFPQGVPDLQKSENWWLLPLIAQKNGYCSMAVCTQSEAQASAARLGDALCRSSDSCALAVDLARSVKHHLKGKRLP
jgi:hypothetical protein